MAGKKIAVVTGSSSGIGMVSAVEVARNGYRVVATMRDLRRSARLEEAARNAAVRNHRELRRVHTPNTLAEIVSRID